MSNSNYIILSDSDNSDSDNEIMPNLDHEMAPNPDSELTPHPIENEPSEDEPSEDEPSEYEPSEEEPSEEEREGPAPTRTPSLKRYRNYPNEPLMKNTPRKSVKRSQTNVTPTLADSSSSSFPSPPAYYILDSKNWKWVWDVLEGWRLEEGNSFAKNGASSSHTQVYPVNGTPPSHTIPLMIAHMSQQETKMDLLKDEIEALPGTEYHENLENHMQKMGSEILKLKGDTRKLESWARSDVNRIDRIEERMSRIEHNLEILHHHICGLINKGRNPPN